MRSKYGSSTALHDILFLTLLGFVFLFIMSFLMIEPEKKDANIKTKAEFVITLTWAHGSTDDVDIWVEDPVGNLLFFRQKDIGLMHLDRDDLGELNDKVKCPDGTTTINPINQEIVSIRGFIPGEWVVNVHMYSKRDREKPVVKPTTVEVEMKRLNPSVETVFYKKLIMAKHFEEITIARFEMSSDGRISNLNELPKKLIESKTPGSITNLLPDNTRNVDPSPLPDSP